MIRLNKLYRALCDIIVQCHQYKFGPTVISSEIKDIEGMEGFEHISFLTTEQEGIRSHLSTLVEELARSNPKRNSLLNYILYACHLIKPMVLNAQFVEPDIACEKQDQISRFVIHMFQLLQIQAPTHLTVEYDGKSHAITGLKNKLLDVGGSLSRSGTLIQDKLFVSLFPFLPKSTVFSEDFIKQTIQDIFIEHQYGYLLSQHQALIEANQALRRALRTPIPRPLLRTTGLGFFSNLFQILPTDSAIPEPVLESEYETSDIKPDFDSY